MADELQALLDRINAEGLKKADAECDRLLTEARAQSARLVEDAHAEAERIAAAAREEAGLSLDKGRESLRQAARDVLLSLREQLEQRVRAVAKAGVAEAVNAEALADILADLIQIYMAKEGRFERVEVVLPEDKTADVQRMLHAMLGAELREQCELKPAPDLAGGFRLVFDGQDIVYDFSDEALAEALAAFLHPRLAEIVTGT